MRIPFERLAEQVAGLSAEDQELSLGTLAERFGVTTARLCDAVDALKMLRGERTYLPYVVPDDPPPAFFDAHDLAAIEMHGE